MKFSIKSGSPEKQRTACLVLGVYEGKNQPVATMQADQASKGRISALIKQGDITGKPGSTLLLQSTQGIAADRILLLGLGKEKNFDAKAYRTAIKTAAKALLDSPATDAVVCFTDTPLKKHSAAWSIRQAVLAFEDSIFRFDEFKTKSPNPPIKLQSVKLIVDKKSDIDQAEKALLQAKAIAEGQALAKRLGNLPGNVCTPLFLANTAEEIAQDLKLESRIFDEKAISELGMGSFLSVAKGSALPPRLIQLSYRGAGNQKPFVLVGKGITFDTGGISLKPGPDMDEMKFDMCGAASVLGTLYAVAKMKLPINLTVLVPACENMPGGRASKPGDIVTSMSGQTIEILNTDAEGRLILCDALTYAERFNPAVVIDVATLTGACVVALGAVTSGLFTAHDGLARELTDAGELSGDRTWRMPLWDDYQDLLKSNFADMANIGGRYAGAITAACFLARFAEKYTWAHLDIAGVSHKSGSEKGATGRPVPLLTHYLMASCDQLQ